MGSKKVTLTLDGVDTANKKSSMKIPYVNPNVSDDVMRTFANKCAALSTDTHTATTKTIDEDITTAETPKPQLTLEVDNTELARVQFDNTGAAYRFAKFPNTIGALPKLTVDITAWDDNDREVGAFWGPNNFVSAGFARLYGDYIIGVCTMSEPGGSRYLDYAVVNFHFGETETTAATQYRLTITRNAGEATFVQV